MNRDLRVAVDFGSADPCDLPLILAAVGEHLGLDGDALRKAALAATDEGDDPNFPKLTRILELAVDDWRHWGDGLVDAVVDLHARGHLFPLNQTNERALRAVLLDHEDAIVARFSGQGADPARLEQLRSAGLLPARKWWSWTELAYRVGRAVDHLKAIAPAGPWKGTRQQAQDGAAQTLDVRDRAVLEHCERRTAIYMRRPATVAIGEMELEVGDKARLLTEAELGIVRGAVAEAAAAKWSAQKLAQELRARFKDHPTLQNDMLRVARTELTNAHAAGSCASLRVAAEKKGEPDPLVYKIVSPRACADCKRIWGVFPDVRTYRLSFVEGRDATGGNFRLPRAEWGPVVGAAHPRCSEASLLLYDPRIVGGAAALAKKIARTA